MYEMFVFRFMVIVWGFCFLVACDPSKIEKSCGNTTKENNNMTSEMGSAARDVPPLITQKPVPAGQETAIFGMG
jgi:hypothetical protein